MQIYDKKDVLSLTPDELTAFITESGYPKFRAKQILEWMYRGKSFSEMTTLPEKMRTELDGIAVLHLPKIKRKLVSEVDGTVKYLFSLFDGNLIESVVMRYAHGLSICISSQCGCRMGCRFCASTIGGRIRDLLPSELLGQIIVASADLGERISHVVMMGIGEPLDNFDNVVKFLRIVNLPEGINIGYRHISLSTCGVVPKIYELAKLDLPITLSISLHAPDDDTRSAIMPVNNAWGVGELLDACREYYKVTERRMSFEYTLISGKNDSPDNAVHLANVLNSKLRSRSETMPIHVNLIPVNEVEESGFKSSGRDSVRRFAAELEKRGIRATIRRTLGSDINASCGQLRREESNK